jgi:uncharacterized protein YciI
MKKVYAGIWESNASQEEFDAKVPQLMAWLHNLKNQNKLRSCGGCNDEKIGGLTVIEASNLDEAKALFADYPLNSIGHVIMVANPILKLIQSAEQQ